MRLLFILVISALLMPSAPAQGTTREPRKIGKYTVVSELPRLPVESQGRTGTCWCFATTSFLETEVARITGEPVDLSEMFVVRHATLEKSRRYVMLDGKAQFSEGGLSHDVIAMVKKHGIVPQKAYDGLAGGQKFHDHSEMFSLLESVLKKLTGENAKPSAHWMRAVAGVVDAYLGAPPKEITVGDRTMTPKEYAKRVVQIPVNDYVEVMSYSYAPFHEKAQLLVPDNWMMYGGYLNLPLNEFMANFDSALERGFSVAVDLDVSESTYRAGQGVGKLDKDLEEPGAVTQEVRDRMFATRSTTDDHLMHVVGIVKDDAGKRWYLTKDSWGKNHGRLKGYRVLSEAYVRAKVLAYMVHKDALIAR